MSLNIQMKQTDIVRRELCWRAAESFPHGFQQVHWVVI